MGEEKDRYWWVGEEILGDGNCADWLQQNSMHGLVCYGGCYPLPRSTYQGSKMGTPPSLLLTSSVSIKLSSVLDILENVHYNMTYIAKAKSQQSTRRKSSLVKRADQLVRLCNIDLALIIRKNGKYYTYRSTDQEVLASHDNRHCRYIHAVLTTSKVLIESIIESIIPVVYQSIIQTLIIQTCKRM